MAKTLDYIQKSILIGADPPSDDTDINNGSINVSITKTNDDFNPTQAQIQERAKYIKRGHESALMNDTTKSSVVIRHDGQINISSNRYAQYKLNPSGKIVEESLESVSLSNRRKVQTDDMVLNEHKLNPYLYELTDFKKLMTAYNDNMFVGNFCLFGSVLTMAWEMNLKRYVLIRRPARMPMFSPVLNVPEINTGLGVTDPLKIDETLLAKSTKGYQVNAVISDSKSLIGKEGQARFGTNSGNIINYNDGTGSASQNTNAQGLPNVNVVGANDRVSSAPIPDSVPYASMANTLSQISRYHVNPRLIWAQLYHETGGFTSELSKYRNYGGIEYSGQNGAYNADGRFAGFYTDEDFSRAYVGTIDGHHEYQVQHNYLPAIGNAVTPLEYAVAMFRSDYYVAEGGRSEQQEIEMYVNGMVNALQKIPS